MNRLLTQLMRRSIMSSFILGTVLFSSCRSSYILTGIQGEKIEMSSVYDIQPDRETTAILLPYKMKQDSVMNSIIGTSEKELKPYRPESPLSNFAADVLKEGASDFTDKSIDMALTNMGGLRNTLSPGNITVGDIFEIFPFENHLCIVTLDGKTLNKLLEQIAYLRGEGISGPRMVITHEGKIKSVQLNGKNIEPGHLYTIATLDYLAEGNDGMKAFLDAKDKECYEHATIRKIMLDYVNNQTKKGKIITSSVDGRIVIE